VLMDMACNIAWSPHAKVSLEGMELTAQGDYREVAPAWWLLKLRQMGDSKNLNERALSMIRLLLSVKEILSWTRLYKTRQ
jgi:hypothetical protein